MRQTITTCIAVFLVTLGLVGCQASGGGGPNTWLDTPLDGMEFDVQEPVTIMAHASDVSGVTRFEFYVDEKLIAVDAGSGGRLGKGDAGWVPPAAGIYHIHARATNGAGSVGTDAISRIVVRDAQSVIVCCPVPRERSTETPTPTVPPPVPPPSTDVTITPPPPPPMACANAAVLLQDVTVPPGTALAPNQTFKKIWRVLNSGTCAWDARVLSDYVGGEAMSSQMEIAVPATAPGATADLLVAMTAPPIPGQHYTQWRMHDSQRWFGPGLEVWINVVSTQPAPQPQPQCPGAPIIASFSADTTTINAGQTTTLRWGAVGNATSVTIDPDIGGVATPSYQVVAPARTTTYTLTATGCGGTVRRQVTVVVSSAPQPPPPPPPPVCPGPPVISSFSADPSTINAGQSFTLSWGAVTNATSVTIDPDVGGVTTPGYRVIVPRTTTIYTLTATGCGGTTRRQATITVNSAPPPPPPPPPPPTLIVPTTFIKPPPPSISNESASCGQNNMTYVSATVTTAVGVDRVVARLGGVGSGDMPMSQAGSIYRVLVPFGPGLTVQVIAWDRLGSSAQSRVITVSCLK